MEKLWLWTAEANVTWNRFKEVQEADCWKTVCLYTSSGSSSEIQLLETRSKPSVHRAIQSGCGVNLVLGMKISQRVTADPNGSAAQRETRELGPLRRTCMSNIWLTPQDAQQKPKQSEFSVTCAYRWLYQSSSVTLRFRTNLHFKYFSLCQLVGKKVLIAWHHSLNCCGTPSLTALSLVTNLPVPLSQNTRSPSTRITSATNTNELCPTPTPCRQEWGNIFTLL